MGIALLQPGASSIKRIPVRRKLSLRPFLFTWMACWVFWLVLSDSTGWHEMLVGAASAAVALVAVVAFLLETGVRFTIRWSFLKEAIQVPRQLVADTRLLLLVVLRRMFGARSRSGIMAVAFRRGADSPPSRARRAFAITLLTVTPNTLVLGISEKDGVFLFHTVVPRPLPPFLIRLGAQPESEP